MAVFRPFLLVAAVASLLQVVAAIAGNAANGETVPTVDRPGQSGARAAEVMLEVVCLVSANDTDCSAATTSLETALEAIFTRELGIPEELLTVKAACGKDEQGVESPSQVFVDVLVQIPADVSTNVTAYDPSAVEHMIGHGVNQSSPDDYFNPIVQVVTLNVVARGAMLSAEMLERDLASTSELSLDVAVDSVNGPTVVLKTSTTTTSTSSSRSSPTTTSTTAAVSDTSVLTFNVLIAIEGSGSSSNAEAAEAFRKDMVAIYALRMEFAANVSVPPSTVEVTVAVLPGSGSTLRWRMATEPNVQISFRVRMPTAFVDRVESGTRALSVAGFQELVNAALAASPSKETYATASVESIQDITLIDPEATITTTAAAEGGTAYPLPIDIDAGSRSASGMTVGVALIMLSVALSRCQD